MEIKKTILKKYVDHFDGKEWPGIRGYKLNDLQLFIMELGRLVPFKKGKYIRFFPFNMPMTEIGCIHIIGLILEVFSNEKLYEFTVDDGTGTLAIKYSKRHCTQQQNQAQTSKDGSNSSIMKDLRPGNYVHLEGFLSLVNYKQISNDSKDEDCLKRFKYGQPVFYAVNVKFINENQYYEKVNTWFTSAIKRYN